MVVVGLSVGDLVLAAKVTHSLIAALNGSRDAGEDYRATIDELECMRKAFLGVSCLGANPNVSQATFDSASFIVMGSMEVIESFLAKTKNYDRRLGRRGTSGIAQNLRKVGWTLYKADDMKKLRETLHIRLTSLNALLAAANLGYLNVSSQAAITHTSATSSVTEPVPAKVSQPPSVLGVSNEEDILAVVNPPASRHAPPPSTTQMHSQHMAFSSPAPFWKFVDLPSMSAKAPLERIHSTLLASSAIA